MYKTWFQRQKASSPFKASAMLIHNAGKMGSGVPIADSAIDMKPKSEQKTEINKPPNPSAGEEGENTDVASLQALEAQLAAAPEEKKQEIQDQITELKTRMAIKNLEK
jgi:hypothetical protein